MVQPSTHLYTSGLLISKCLCSLIQMLSKITMLGVEYLMLKFVRHKMIKFNYTLQKKTQEFITEVSCVIQTKLKRSLLSAFDMCKFFNSNSFITKLIWDPSRQNQHNGCVTSMDPDQPVQAGLDLCWSQTHYVGFVVMRLKCVHI
jgi:hypothetical protein